MLKFIDRERVVAVGEIGYNLINELEEDIFMKQLDIASTKKIPVMIHLPHENKTKGIERIEEILNQNGNKYDRKKILIDHNTEETIKNIGNGIVGWPFGLSFNETFTKESNRYYKKKWIR
jgi:uncharacterized protein